MVFDTSMATDELAALRPKAASAHPEGSPEPPLPAARFSNDDRMRPISAPAVAIGRRSR